VPDNALVVLERQMAPLAPRFAEVLGRTMPVERLIRTIMISVERLPKLLDCDRQSLFNAAMSAACLGLEVDGVTGQAFLIPFKGKAQLVIGYKGINTMAARSGIMITGAVVRDGDEFDFALGSDAFVKHVPRLGNNGRILAAWAVAAAHGRPNIIAVMGIDDLLAVKNKSPGAQRSDSPWNDPTIGFPAMCEKTVKRRLARSLPLNIMTAAARMDEAFDEQGAHTWMSPEKGVVIEGEVVPSRHNTETPTAQELIGETETEALMRWDATLGAAAEHGMKALQDCWLTVPSAQRATLKAALDRRHKVTAAKVDETATPAREHRRGGDDPAADIQPPATGQTVGAPSVGDVPAVDSADEAGGRDAATARLPAHDLFDGDQK
jgi:recombination protein RecT